LDNWNQGQRIATYQSLSKNLSMKTLKGFPFKNLPNVFRSSTLRLALAHWLLANGHASPDDTVATYRGETLCMSGKAGELAPITLPPLYLGTVPNGFYRPDQ
jgi:hypothetical protein